jgi:hypothetical protein
MKVTLAKKQGHVDPEWQGTEEVIVVGFYTPVTRHCGSSHSYFVI